MFLNSKVILSLSLSLLTLIPTIRIFFVVSKSPVIKLWLGTQWVPHAVVLYITWNCSYVAPSYVSASEMHFPHYSKGVSTETI